MDSNAYHLQELYIASTLGDQRRIMPSILESYRRILDVGCGAGQTLIASKLESVVKAVGVDIDRSALSLGRQLSNTIQFVCAKGEALPFKSEYFDLVISRLAMPYMPIHSSFAEMWRVLKEGGSLWIVLHHISMTIKELIGNLSHFEIRGAIYQIYVMANGVTLHFLGKEFRSQFRGDCYESFQTNRGITRALRLAGFENIKIDRDDFFVVTAGKGSTKPISRNAHLTTR